MRKIITSVIAIALTVGVVSGTAYALFSDTVKVSGLTLSTGNADLQITTNPAREGWLENINFGNDILADKMYPGYQSPIGTFYLKNNSASKIDLKVTAQLMSVNEVAANSWNTLKDVVQMRIENTAGGGYTPWYTLQEWNSAPRNLPQELSPQGDSDPYEIQVRLLSSTGNEVAEKWLNNIRFDLVGTQIPE